MTSPPRPPIDMTALSSAPPAPDTREDRDAYLFEILRALDARIDRVSAAMAALPAEDAPRALVRASERRELRRRLDDLHSAREDLVDVVFRAVS